MENIKNINELFYRFGDFNLANYSLSDIDSIEDNNEVTVYAVVKERGSPIYSDGVYEVKRTYDRKPITEKINAPKTMKKENLIDLMPNRIKSKKAVLSARGQYIDVIEHNPNGRNIGRTYCIPVEFIIKP